MTSRDIRDMVGGLLLIALGLFAAFYGERYELGSLQRMGPGYFPVALGVILAILGVFVFVPALFRQGTKIQIQWKSLVWVIISLLIFALLLDVLGLLITCVLTVIAASMPSDLTWKPKVILGVCVALITYGIFSFGLGMLMPVWPWSH